MRPIPDRRATLHAAGSNYLGLVHTANSRLAQTVSPRRQKATRFYAPSAVPYAQRAMDHLSVARRWGKDPS
jgi:hypothetical protein